MPSKIYTLVWLTLSLRSFIDPGLISSILEPGFESIYALPYCSLPAVYSSNSFFLEPMPFAEHLLNSYLKYTGSSS